MKWIRFYRAKNNLGNPGMAVGASCYIDFFSTPYRGVFVKVGRNRFYINLNEGRISRAW